MIATLPSRITDYRITLSSPTDELMTLGRIFSEVGGYASTILGKESLRLARLCNRRLSKVVKELRSRERIHTAADLFEISQAYATKETFEKNQKLTALREISFTDRVEDHLRHLTIDQLHNLYCNRSERQRVRRDQGRELLTYWFESHIVAELRGRKSETTAEQLKIDYCLLTYKNELDNLSSILDLPIKSGAGERLLPDGDDLLRQIQHHRNYRDITGRELLIEYVDHALDLIDRSEDYQPHLGLISELLEIGRKEIISMPSGLLTLLKEGIAHWKKNPEIPETEVVIPLLTLHLHTGDPRHERAARRILNRSWRICREALSTLEVNPKVNPEINPKAILEVNPEDISEVNPEDISEVNPEDISEVNPENISEDMVSRLHIVVSCADYVTRFSPCRAIKLFELLSASPSTRNHPLLPSIALALKPSIRGLFYNIDHAQA